MKLDAIGIVSGSLIQSRKFYNLLGLEFQSAGSEQHWEAVTDGGLRVMLDDEKLIKQLNPSWEKPKTSGITLCFQQNSASKVDEVYGNLVVTGLGKTVKEPFDAFWGQRYATIQDPDGNQIDLFAELKSVEKLAEHEDAKKRQRPD